MENPESAEWQAPSPPEKIASEEAPQMSELETIGNIFFEPGRTFEDLRRKPRFIIATVIISLLTTAYAFGLYYKVGEAGMRQFAMEQLDKNAQTSGMDAAAKAGAVDLQLKIGKIIRYLLPIFVAVVMLIGGLMYWGGAKAFGGTGNFMHGWSVFLYSSIPPTVIGSIANFIVLAFKSADEIDIGA